MRAGQSGFDREDINIDALKICNEHLDNKYLEGQKVAILVYMNRYKEALEIVKGLRNEKKTFY